MQSTSQLTAEQVASKLQNSTKTGDGWLACCPAHADEKPSLSIKDGDNGKLLLFCHAGCEFSAILHAIGLAPTKAAKKKSAAKPSSHKTGSANVLAEYIYCDEHGGPLFRVQRTSDKKFIQQSFEAAHTENGISIKDRWAGGKGCMNGVRRVLFQLPDVTKADAAEPVQVHEGEKDCNNAKSLGFLATTSSMGARNWDKSEWSPLYNRTVHVFPDNDDEGRAYAANVAAHLAANGSQVKIVSLPGLPDKGDVTDWVESRRTKGKDDAAIAAELAALVEAAPAWAGLPAVTVGGGTNAQILLALAADAGVHLFNWDSEAYGVFPVCDHYETLRIPSAGVRQWLSREFYLATNKPPGGDAMRDALGVLQAQAIHDGPAEQVHIRIAGNDEVVFLDLCDVGRNVVAVDGHGWRIANDIPVRFLRPRGMRPLPIPESGGDLAELRQFLNCGKEDAAFILGVAWLVGALRPRGPYPVLGVTGEQGSAKSTFCRVLRDLVDPNAAALRSAPREPRDLHIAAGNGWDIAFDNVSSIPAWLSDALCRIATGGGFATRELYSDDAEKLFDAQRPIMLNGIEEFIQRPDLLERSVIVSLPPVTEALRRAESELWRDFHTAAPRILGALLNAVSTAIVNLPATKLPTLPRMADFAVWVAAAEPALPWPAGEFAKAYAANRECATLHAIEASAIGPALVAMMEALGEYSGTPSELLDAVSSDEWSTGSMRGRRGWPKAANTLSGQIKRLTPDLRRAGIMIQTGYEGKRKRISLKKVPHGSTASTESGITRQGTAAAAVDCPDGPSVAIDGGGCGSTATDHAHDAEKCETVGAVDADGLSHNPADDDKIPVGWSVSGWIADRRRRAEQCEASGNHQAAAEFRAEADELETTINGGTELAKT